MTATISKYWFLTMLASLFFMPLLIDLNALPTLIIPMVISVAILFQVTQDFTISKYPLFILLIMLVSQALLNHFLYVPMPLKALLGCVWFILALFVFDLTRQKKKYVDIYYLSFIAVAMLWVITGAYVWFGLDESKLLFVEVFDHRIALTQGLTRKPTGPFMNGNVFGIMMVVAWVISACLFIREKETRKALVILPVFFLVWVFVSLSKGAWIAWFVVFIGIVFSLIKGRKIEKTLWVVMSVFVSWFISDLVLGSGIFTSQLSNVAQEGVSSLSDRVVLYASILEIWKENWILGVGFGNLSAHYALGQALAFNYLPDSYSGLGYMTSAHNHLLHLLAEAGLAGFIVWFSISLYMLRLYYKFGLDVKHEAWLPINICLSLWIQGFFNVSMSEPLPFFVFATFLGLSAGLGKVGLTTLRIGSYVKLTRFSLVVVTLLLAMNSSEVYRGLKLMSDLEYEDSLMRRGEILQAAMVWDYTFPIAVTIGVYDMSRSNRSNQFADIQETIIDALKINGYPALYQSLFYSYVLKENWQKACFLGKFLKSQHWKRDGNIKSYELACQGKRTEEFVVGWVRDDK